MIPDSATHRHTSANTCVICSLLMSLIASVALATLLLAPPLAGQAINPVDLPPVLALSECLEQNSLDGLDNDPCLPSTPVQSRVSDTDRMAPIGHPVSSPMRRVFSTHPPRAPPASVSV